MKYGLKIIKYLIKAFWPLLLTGVLVSCVPKAEVSTISEEASIGPTPVPNNIELEPIEPLFVTIDNLASNNIVNLSNIYAFQITGSCSDSFETVKINVFNIGERIVLCDVSQRWSATLDFTNATTDDYLVSVVHGQGTRATSFTSIYTFTVNQFYPQNPLLGLSLSPMAIGSNSNNTNPTISGTGYINEGLGTFKVYGDANCYDFLGQATINVSGDFNVPLTLAIDGSEDGYKYFYGIVSDLAGNSNLGGCTYLGLNYYLDSQAPNITGSGGLVLTDPIAGSFSPQNMPIISGGSFISEVGSTLKIYRDSSCGQLLGSSLILSNGQINQQIYTFANNGSDDGLIQFYGQMTDLSQNIGNCASLTGVSYNLDTVAPTYSGQVAMVSPLNNTTSNNVNPLFSFNGFTNENGTVVEVYRFSGAFDSNTACNQNMIGSGTIVNGNVSIIGQMPTNGSNDGNWKFAAQLIDQVGNISTCENLSLGYTLDTILPTPPIGFSLTNVINGATSAENNPQIDSGSIPAQDGSGTVFIYLYSTGPVPICSNLVGQVNIPGGGGVVSILNITLATEIDNRGLISFAAIIQDAGGNKSQCTDLFLGYNYQPPVQPPTSVTVALYDESITPTIHWTDTQGPSLLTRYDIKACSNNDCATGCLGTFNENTPSLRQTNALTLPNSTNNYYICMRAVDDGLNASAWIPSTNTVRHLTNILQHYNNSPNTDQEEIVYDSFTDSDNNFYVCGQTVGDIDGTPNLGGGGDAFISKISNDGLVITSKRMGTAAGDIARACAIDSNGDIYMAGITAGDFDVNGTGSLNIDLFIVKFNNDFSVTQWNNHLDGVGLNEAPQALRFANNEILTDMILGSNENPILVGHTNSTLEGSSGGGNDLFVLQFDKTNGDLLNIEQLDGVGNYETSRFDPSGSDTMRRAIYEPGRKKIYLIGQTDGNLTDTNGGASDPFLIEFDETAYEFRWGVQLNSTGLGQPGKMLTGAGTDDVYGIDIASNGNILLSGETDNNMGETNGGNTDCWVAKLNYVTGELLGLTQLGLTTAGGSADQSEGCDGGIKQGPNGMIYVGGATFGYLQNIGQTNQVLGASSGLNGDGSNYMVMAFDNDLVFQWTFQITDTDASIVPLVSTNNTDLATSSDLQVNESGVSIFGVTTSNLTSGANGTGDFFFGRISTNGTFVP